MSGRDLQRIARAERRYRNLQAKRRETETHNRKLRGWK